LRFSSAREQIATLLGELAALFPATVCTGAVFGKFAICGESPCRSIRSRFRFGFGQDPLQRTRRALVVLCASLALTVCWWTWNPPRRGIHARRDWRSGEPDPERLR